MNTCVGIQVLLELLEKRYSVETKAGTIVSTGEKQQLWSMLLYFDSRVVTSRILDFNFLDTAVFSRLLTFDVNTQSTDSLNQRLEAAMYLEVLVFAASRRGKSVNTHMLFGETCKLLLQHDIIEKEATYVRKATDSSSLSQKHVAVCKRVMQLVCCLCIDFSSQSTSRVFIAQLEAVGIPDWALAFHQAQPTEHETSRSDQLLTRVDLFWKDWQGRGAVENPTRKSEKTLVQAAPRMQRSVFERATNHRMQVKPSVLQLDSDDDEAAAKTKKPMVSNSPVNRRDTAPNPPKLGRVSRARATSKMNASVIETLLSIDTESALHLAKKKQPGQQPKDEIDDDVLDSDAYSALTGGSSEEEIKQKRRAPHKSRARRRQGEEKQSKQLESKTQQNSSRAHGSQGKSSDSENSLSATSRRDRARSKAKSSHKAPSKRSKAAEPPRNQQHEALLGVFRKYDVDGDGVISFIDLRRAMDNQGHRLSDVEIQRWITEKDKGGQGVVSFEDFVVAFQGQLQHT
ncbi:hypothetical protein V7S43_013291 [Phytophthora oleae]|uniref:EF-hand domain-containing protein n=1 Tax=Phytophthora oleae TaxID=2107226 RepID=A0ABD3F587_9STRA